MALGQDSRARRLGGSRETERERERLFPPRGRGDATRRGSFLFVFSSAGKRAPEPVSLRFEYNAVARERLEFVYLLLLLLLFYPPINIQTFVIKTSTYIIIFIDQNVKINLFYYVILKRQNTICRLIESTFERNR